MDIIALVRGTAAALTGFLERYGAVAAPFALLTLLLAISLCQTVFMLRHEKKCHGRLLEKDVMLDSLIRNIPGGVAVFDSGERTRLEYFSEGLPRLCGRSRTEFEELVRDNQLMKTVHGEDRAYVSDFFSNAAKCGGSASCSFRILKKNGGFVWAQVSAVKISEKNGVPTYYCVITGQSDDAVQYRNICESSPTGIIVTDERGAPLYENRFAASLFGKPTDNYNSEKESAFSAVCSETATGTRMSDGCFVRDVRLPGTDTIYCVRSREILWNGSRAQIRYFQDVTYRAKAERDQLMLKKAKAENAAKTDFLARMSHDFRTPLNAIIGFSSPEMYKIADSAHKNTYFEKINMSGKYLLGLINNMLDMSKIGSRKTKLFPSPVSFAELLESIRAVILPVAKEKKIQFTVCGDTSDKPVFADKTRLQQIIINLLSNAVSFTPSGGKIELQVSEIRRTQTRYDMLFTVSDNGIGMSEEFIGHAFEPFSQECQLLAPDSGTGMGLAVVKKLVKLMNGEIYVKSTPGSGTVFTVELPLEKAVARQSLKKPSDSSLDGARILLCEDHPLNTQIAVRLLEAKGASVVCAADGKAGVDKFEDSAPGYFDAVLMDMRMPVLDGTGATKSIRRLNRPDARTVPIIAISANIFPEDLEKAESAGISGYLPKPIDPGKLYAVLSGKIARRRA